MIGFSSMKFHDVTRQVLRDVDKKSRPPETGSFIPERTV